MKTMLLLAAVLLTAACGSVGPIAGASPSPSSAPSASASPSAAASPTPSPAPTPTPLASPSPTPTCATYQGGTSTARAIITDVRVGAHPGYDRLVIEFAGGLPPYKLVWQDPSTFVGPFSGLPVKVAGSAGMHLFIYNMDIPPTYQHGNILTTYAELMQVVVMADFEGQADIAIGLARKACPAVTTLSGPPRLVIDFPT